MESTAEEPATSSSTSRGGSPREHDAAKRVAAGGRPPWHVHYEDGDALPPRGLRGILEEWGCAVVSGVVTSGECKAWGDSISGFFESLGTGVRISDDNVAGNCPRSQWVVNNGGLCHNFGCGHLPAVWEARCHRRVRALFGAIWGTDALACSFDGVNVDRPKVNQSRQPPKLSLHTDQDPHSNPGDAMHCVQAVLSLTTTVAASAGTTLIPGSHKFHEEMLLREFPVDRKEHKKDWIVLSDPMLEWLRGRAPCGAVHIETRPGDVVLWDSRTIHCGRRASAINDAGWRLAIYICMWPDSWLDEEARRRRRGAFSRAQTTSHWPDAREVMHHMPHFQNGKVPKGLPADPGVHEPPSLGEVGQRLATVLDY